MSLIPIVTIDASDKINFENTVQKLSSSHKVKKTLSDKFLRHLVYSSNIEKTSKKLESWHELEFADFLKELNKAIKATNKIRSKENHPEIPALTKLDEMDWMDAFEVKKKEAQELQTQIQQTEKQIDQMVYKLYGLTEEEIAIVEKS
ncbi:hypothetical protein [Nonlabens sp. Hel1_33_55]|uniref:hypothetical protein n=1 Tax=Nonlabens sp. Hel1_33_55 TaxID=1336802 RepID=UPI000B81521E|nr:hypothetical protein [Nonlabens sp. Hel1_33_55]